MQMFVAHFIKVVMIKLVRTKEGNFGVAFCVL